MDIKKDLANQIHADITSVSETHKVSQVIVTHIANLNAYSFILPELNFVIFNRSEIRSKRINRNIINLYREGHPYSLIGEVTGIHSRNVIRRVREITNENDDRCRLNSINRRNKRRYNRVQAVKGMGYNKQTAKRMLGYSSCFISSAWDDNIKLYTDLSETRGLNNL